MRFITVEAAIKDANKRGVIEITWDAVIPGGLSGHDQISRILIVEDLIYDFVTTKDNEGRCYLYTSIELADNERYRSYVTG